MASQPPVPTIAEWDAGTVRVRFDAVLRERDALDVGNWWVRYSNVLRNVLSARSHGATVRLDTSAGSLDFGPNAVNYSPPPFDLSGVCGVLVAAFAGLPFRS